MTKEERVCQLEEAREKIAEALEMIRDATEGNTYVEAYLCAPLAVMVEEGAYLSHDVTISWVIERVNEEGIGVDDDLDEEDIGEKSNGMAAIDDKRGQGYGEFWCTSCGSSSGTLVVA